MHLTEIRHTSRGISGNDVNADFGRFALSHNGNRSRAKGFI